MRENGSLEGVVGYETRRTPMELLQSVEYDIMVELTPMEVAMSQASYGYIEAVLKRGKHAITANKATVAWAYKELKDLAKKNKAMFMYEATVMDGMPLFNMKRNALDMCDILEIKGILNRTTNYILEEMTANRDKELADILEDVKQYSFAESDLRLDIEGHDAAAKIAVLANALMVAEVTPDDVDFQGIVDVTQADIADAESRGNVIRLICRAYRENGAIKCQVKPEEVPANSVYAQIAEASSILTIKTDVMGDLTFIEETNNPAEATGQSAYGILSDVMYLVKDYHRHYMTVKKNIL
jgi:homoserine dehydrogenase